jgi:2-dehydro-3-deoxy-D-arabinonate dehydratase
MNLKLYRTVHGPVVEKGDTFYQLYETWQDLLVSENLVQMWVDRNGLTALKGMVALSQMRRTSEELVGFVRRECSFPFGCFIMTGTGIVPKAAFTLMAGDVIHISIEGIGTLTNTVAENL